MDEDFRNKEEAKTAQRAGIVGLRYIDARQLNNRPVFRDVIPLSTMYKMRAVPLKMETGSMMIAITDKSPTISIQSFKDQYPDYNVEFAMISEEAYKEFMLLYDPPEKVVYKDIAIEPAKEEESIAEVTATLARVRADDMFDYLVKQAKMLGASDIHLENQKNHLRVRVRVDGVLHEIATIEKEKYRQLMSTIAVAANISTEAPEPQTGHIDYQPKPEEGQTKPSDEINMRIETVPTIAGQDVVLRIFQIDRELMKVENLGLSQKQKEHISRIIKHPTGLVMSVGPTGSGKTTTLYSIISALNTSQKKIITLEDPVEFTIPGIVQIPVNTQNNESFADKLRAVLRLDPDIVMVGEIRDVDTAKTALQASLSGHLVLTTFHANSAPAALSRLLDMIGENPLFGSAIRLVIAQRLVRTFGKDSRQEAQIDDFTGKKIQEIISEMPQNVEKPDLNTTQFYSPVKTKGNPFGYLGQTAIIEMLTMSPGIQEILRQPSREITTERLIEQAKIDGMVTMIQDGVLKAAAGVTSVDEVFRVI